MVSLEYSRNNLLLLSSFPDGQAQAYTHAWCYSSSNAGPCISPSWTSSGSCLPISPAARVSLNGITHNQCINIPPRFFLPPATLLRVHPTSSFRPWMQMWLSTEFNTNLWGTTLVTDVQLDFAPLITTLLTQTFSHFSTHLTCFTLILSAHLWWSYGRLFKISLKTKLSTSTPFPSYQSHCFRRLSDCISMIYSL